VKVAEVVQVATLLAKVQVICAGLYAQPAVFVVSMTAPYTDDPLGIAIDAGTPNEAEVPARIVTLAPTTPVAPTAVFVCESARKPRGVAPARRVLRIDAAARATLKAVAMLEGCVVETVEVIDSPAGRTVPAGRESEAE
jgi:hypothetical protein